jgi:hypothetical protein
MYCGSLNHLSTRGFLGCFQCGSISNITSTSICVQGFMCPFPFLWDKYLSMHLLGSHSGCMFNFIRSCQTVLKWLYHCNPPPSQQWCCSSAPSPALSAVTVFYFRLFAVVSPCGLVNFLMANDTEHLFQQLFSNFFSKMYLSVFLAHFLTGLFYTTKM